LADRFELAGLTVGGSLEVFGDKGNDLVTVSGAVVGENALLSTDEGVDRLTLTSMEIGKDMIVETGAMNDVAALSQITIFGSIGVNLDSGDDTFSATNVAAQQDAVAIGGAGRDRFTNFGFSGITKREVLEFEL